MRPPIVVPRCAFATWWASIPTGRSIIPTSCMHRSQPRWMTLCARVSVRSAWIITSMQMARSRQLRTLHRWTSWRVSSRLTSSATFLMSSISATTTAMRLARPMPMRSPCSSAWACPPRAACCIALARIERLWSVHCFGEDRATMERFLALGCHIAFGGAATFKRNDWVPYRLRRCRDVQTQRRRAGGVRRLSA